ncbi:hypothetical protein SEA_ENALISNAILO_11 [Gordonia phage EnalisNailo]|uniref:Uncharacterized protein n=1 Tax=Gordonia phage BritBrat TaxID=1838064 RepID=A0A166XYV6_9CAUD|nr:hypothetical protein BH769_gp11 [Gordonia phage BritBrat]AXH48341.1 hypothetical protein SEA_POLLUX_11 [Gordonia phage Pollux]AZV00662.1 hypothetical protein SEA_LILAS_11 [Gordonia phage Lilas]QAY17538.1 hypothetical protein SEA_BRADISSA_11 [Gordonia phage Bradissa]QAY17614.1 hypothetical protein SEA_EMSQUAREDA_11 [Gordonia phage EMsquaredA]QDB74363.1 hypothetical protein SEA_ENALISNAILO_11 [Gordonia phage EnalisNailo]QDP45096.1 hypothetical protein SEA_MARTEENA_11 [Gordonia phage Marteena
MTTIHVVTRSEVNDDGQIDERADKYEGETATFDFEPSGVLVIYRKPSDLWAAYAPGQWERVQDVSQA